MTREVGVKAPVPVATTYSKSMKWRWDYFETEDEAERYEIYRQKTGQGGVKLFAPRKHYNETRWCVVSRVGSARVKKDTMAAWPKTKVDHCRHCDERRTFHRVENKGWKKGQLLRRRFTYTEDEPRHTCPGLEKEMKELQLTNRRLNEMFFGAFMKSKRTL